MFKLCTSKLSLRNSCVVSPGALYPIDFNYSDFVLLLPFSWGNHCQWLNIDQHYSVYVSLEIFLTPAKLGQWDAFWEHWPAQVPTPGVKYFSRFQQNRGSEILLLLLFKKIVNERQGEGDWHPISPKTPAPHYQPIEEKKRKGKYLKTKKERVTRPTKKHCTCSWNLPIQQHQIRGQPNCSREILRGQ